MNGTPEVSSKGASSQIDVSPADWIEAFAARRRSVEEWPEVDVSKMGETPSYRYKLEESKRVRALARQVLGVLDPIHDINDKLKAYDFADNHGIDHPAVFASYPVIDLVEWDRLPEEFVLKARLGANNRAVLALVREDDGSFWDLLRSRRWTRSEIIERQLELDGKGAASMEVFIEELIRKVDGTVADDWKFYCFDGRVALSMQRDLKGSGNHEDWRFRFRDRDWNDLGAIKFVDRLDPTLPPPKQLDAMIEIAERVSQLIGRAFIRIDLFESDRGPLLGEFTPAPGPPEVFSPEVDAMLGRYWEEAEARLFSRQVRRGDWDHLRVAGALGPSGRVPPPEPATGVAIGSMAARPASEASNESDQLVASLRRARAELVAMRNQKHRAEEQVQKLEAKLEHLRSVRDDLRARLDQRERDGRRLTDDLSRSQETEESLVKQLEHKGTEASEARELVRRLVIENEEMRRVVVSLRERRDLLDYRLRVAEWKISAMRSRRWWRLGAIIGAATRQPSRLIRLPIDLVRVMIRPISPPSRPVPKAVVSRSDVTTETPHSAPKRCV